MKKSYKIIIGVVAVVAVAMIITLVIVLNKSDKSNTAASGDSKDTTTAVATTATPTTTADPHAGLKQSYITGVWESAEAANNRPVFVMYSNIYDACPQSNISKAGIVFESLVEGGITRLCCAFENETELEKIGPVRSCRTYYLMFAKEFEALYVHYGYSEYAADYLAQSKFNSMDGMIYCNFYRSTDRVAPHNAYTTWAGIMASAEDKGYTTTLPEGYTGVFTFNEDENKDVVYSSGTVCNKFAPGYPYCAPWFEYDATTKEYKRFQFEAAHVDMETGTQLSFKNIIVKYVEPAYYENGTPNYEIAGTGKGLYISDGYCTEVTWTKESMEDGATKFYTADGKELVINQGKTYYCLVETSQSVTIE